MINWRDIYTVVIAIVPLYVALALGYVSIKWFGMFNPDHCYAINRLNSYFIIPFFTFHYTTGINPYHMNFLFLGSDAIAKAIIGIALALWVKFWTNGNLSWAITSFSLLSFNSTLVVGVPLLEAMYGALGRNLVVQSSVIQDFIWFPLLLFLLEVRQAINMTEGENHLGSTMKKVFSELAKNPNCYACGLGIIWALLAKRWHFGMPRILEGSILIMAKAGSGVSMFSIGLFMGLQEHMIECGVKLTIYGMVLRFVIGPLTMVVGSLILGLRSNILQISIIQAALPQSIVSFIFAQAYDLHANVLSTMVIFGTIVSLPLLIGYHLALGFVP